MKVIADFIKNKIMRVGRRQRYAAGDTKPVNMTSTLLNPKNIIIIPYKRMGTVLLTTRVFKAFREHFADANITVAVHESWSVLIRRDPTIDDVVVFGDYIEDPYSKNFKALGKELSERKFDIAFFLSYQFDNEIAYLIRLSDATLRVSFIGDRELEFFNVGIVPAPGIRYEVERYLEMLRTLGIEGNIRDYTMTISDTIREKARLMYFPAGPVSKIGRIAGFDLTTEIVGNPISKKNAEHSIKTLITDIKSTVVVFYEPAKTAMAAELKEIFGKDIILVEDRPVSMVAGMMSYCRFIVAHNTDLFQLSIALKMPTIGILTENEAVQWSPGESETLTHLIHTDGSWPSSGALIGEVRKIVKQTKT